MRTRFESVTWLTRQMPVVDELPELARQLRTTLSLAT